MNRLTLYETWYGRDEPPPSVDKLRVGRFDVEFQSGDLRCLRFNSRELVRRVYVAIRDVNWNTVPAQISGLAVEAGENGFHITYQALHDDGRLRFRWRALVEGKPDGTIEFNMDGAADSDFRYNRIGFCILLPVDSMAGRTYHAVTPNGPVAGTLPVEVEPQRIENGFEVPIFPSCSSLSVSLADRTALNMAFEGDLFEMEDQRNWTDGSFKIYGTPISLGYPYQAKTGQVFHQKITLTPALPASSRKQRKAPGTDQPVNLRLGGPTGAVLPKLGFGISAGAPLPDPAQSGLLSRLRPDHLRAELHLKDRGWPGVLEHALAFSSRANSPLELALFLPADAAEPLTRLKKRLPGCAVARFIVFSEAEAAKETTQPHLIDQARQALGPVLPGVPFCGGTNGNFAELNRQRPDASAMGGVSYTLNPQVHAFDERSLVEALEAQGDTVRTARSFSHPLPVTVSPVTLKPPFNVVAREAAAPVSPLALPLAADPRQVSLFGAAWTAGSIRSLTAGGVDSVTYYETTGRRGLMDTSSGSGLPGKFPSFPGMIYPLYWVFAFLAEAKGAQMLALETDRPLLVNGMALQKDGRFWLVVSNYQPAGQEIQLLDLPEGQAACLRLNQDTAMIAASDPTAFLATKSPLITDRGQVNFNLQPYETVMVETDKTL